MVGSKRRLFLGVLPDICLADRCYKRSYWLAPSACLQMNFQSCPTDEKTPKSKGKGGEILAIPYRGFCGLHGIYLVK
jgi:hypothetical protein